LFCLSESISDFVNRTETDKVAGFVGCEGVGFDAEDFDLPAFTKTKYE
jgi:hypothetical protein